MNTEQVAIADVAVPAHRARGLNADAVDRLAESIGTLGLQTPITVRYDQDSDQILLVSGLHRLRACAKLGHDKIEAIYTKATPEQARMWEIAENLHRAELSTVERAEHIAEWLRLAKSLPQVASKMHSGNRTAARELGIEREEARRAVLIDKLSPEAKAAAREVGLDDHQTALLRAAKEPPERQAEAIRTYKPAPAIKNAFESEEDWRRALFNVWNRGAQDWRERALEAMDKPVFDRTAAA